VRRWALEDLNVAFPRDRMIELEAEGTIGKLARKAVSMVGSISKFTELIKTTVPRIKAEFDAQGVDLVFLFPF
jgi:D-proline reductase (dithiol) PrdB